MDKEVKEEVSFKTLCTEETPFGPVVWLGIKVAGEENSDPVEEGNLVTMKALGSYRQMSPSYKLAVKEKTGKNIKEVIYVLRNASTNL